MERRVLIALVLSFLVLYVYQTYVVKPPPRPAQTTAQQTQSAGGAKPDSSRPSVAPAGATAAGSVGSAAEAPEAPAARALVGETSERDVRVETQDVVAVITNRG